MYSPVTCPMISKETYVECLSSFQDEKVKNKLKKVNEANVINITRSTLSSSGIGTNTLNDGLTNSRIFGTRVQDRKISLNIPDAASLLGVFESNDSGDADLPSLTLKLVVS